VVSIHDAERSVVGWHAYGCPPTPENWCEAHYTRDGRFVLHTAIGPIVELPTPSRWARGSKPAIRFT
jgi:hypothetical protein